MPRFSPDYEDGYKDGFNEGVKHAKEFIEKSAQPTVVIPAGLISREEAAKIADASAAKWRKDAAAVGRASVYEVYAGVAEGIAATIRALPPYKGE